MPNTDIDFAALIDSAEAAPRDDFVVPPESQGWKEIVVDKKTEQPRQAGATLPEGKFIKQFRGVAERDLYVFSKGVMGRRYLTQDLHLPLCKELQQVPPYRKMRLLPRLHAKTSVVSHCLPPHIIIQPKDNNIYIPDVAGSDCRILLAGETEPRATGNLRVLRTAFDGNQTLRALWPHVVWERASRDAPKWNDKELIVPRETEFPDPTIRAIGVGGAITGARPNVLIKDDLISLEAANSAVVMNAAIEWHKVSRALMDEYEKDTGTQSLEFIVGTRWAVFDLYQYIIENDPTVDTKVRAILESGKPLWPERFDLERIEQLRKEFGALFYLLYMNSAADPELTDFDVDLVREFTFTSDGQALEFSEDAKDAWLKKRIEEGVGTVEQPAPRGQRLTSDTMGLLFGREKGRAEFLRLRYA